MTTLAAVEERISFALRLRAARVAHGLSRTQLAARVNVSERSIQNWEDGAREPSGRYLVALARALGTTAEALWLGEDAHA